MKKFYLILILLASFTIQSQSQNLLTEDFLYQPVDSLENSGNWFRSGLNTEYNIKVASPGLVYPGYSGSGKGNSALIANAGNGDIIYHHFSKAVTSDAVYLSFLFRSDSLPTTLTQGTCISFNPNTGATFHNTSLYIKRLSENTFDLGIRKSEPIEYNNAVYQIGKTYLVVLKYTFLQGVDNDISSIYVFENEVPKSEPAQPHASSAQGEDHPGQASVVLNNNYAQSGLRGCNIRIDGIRVGTSWETSVLAPIISGTSIAGASIFNMENYPNPFSDQTRIRFHLIEEGMVQIDIYNSAGLRVDALLQANLTEGDHDMIWNAGHLPAGSYYCVIRTKGHTAQHPLLIAK